MSDLALSMVGWSMGISTRCCVLVSRRAGRCGKNSEAGEDTNVRGTVSRDLRSEGETGGVGRERFFATESQRHRGDAQRERGWKRLPGLGEFVDDALLAVTVAEDDGLDRAGGGEDRQHGNRFA